MDTIRLLLTGEIDFHEFTEKLRSDISLQEQLSQLVPKDAVENESHPLWQHIYYYALKKQGFDLYQYLLATHKFNGTITDNLNIFGSIRAVYCYIHPEIICTERYSAAFHLYLDVVNDRFDGPEVKHLVESIINDALLQNTRRQQVNYAKDAIGLCFHVNDKRSPRWIQGPEWPMGQDSPMEFVSQKRSGETVSYIFRDVNTNALKTITQMY